jgi:hypothetical protein
MEIVERIRVIGVSIKAFYGLQTNQTSMYLGEIQWQTPLSILLS